MQSRIEGFSITGGLQWRAWSGVVADVWTVEGAPGAGGDYVSDYPRLFAVLEESGEGSVEICSAPDARTGARAPLSYIPAGLRVWSHLDKATRLRHLDLHFDPTTFAGRFPGCVDAARLETPRLMFADDRLLALCRLIAAECTEASGLNDLYGDGLTLAAFMQLFGVAPVLARRRSPLSPRQLRRVTAFIEDNCLRNIRLRELAALAELSESYFSHAFKASTGVTPHQWQMKARIERVKILLRNRDLSLTEIAAETGFSDPAHFTRMFRRQAGVSPSAWRRAHAV